MKKLSILVAFALLCSTAYAKQINESLAATIAGKYLKSATRSLKALRTSNGTENNSEYYIFNSGSDNGFVIISGDDELTELVGYADNGSFSTADMPENLTNWLDGYANYVRMYRDGKASAQNTKLAAATTVVAPLVTTKWNQNEPYNNLCPGTPSRGYCPTGCAATAFAQVMNYWEWPKTGKGLHSYRNDFRTETVDFSKSNYDWANMRDEYLYGKDSQGFIVGDWKQEEADAVAKLMYDCGVALNMEYSYYGSGANDHDIKYSAAKHFKYNSKLYPRNAFTSDQYLKIILTELDNKRPVLFGGQGSDGGHEFVVDGYDSNHYLHVNWGWGGMSDGFFNIDFMAPDDLGTGGGAGGFKYEQSIVLIEPDKTGTPTSNDDYLAIIPAGYIDQFEGYLKPIDQKVTKGEKMKIAVNGIWNYTTQSYMGDFGLAVFNKAGERLTTPVNTIPINLESAYLTTTDDNVYLGSELNALKDGIYYVYPVSKQVNPKKDTEWMRVATYENFMIEIAGNEVSIHNEDFVLELSQPIKASNDVIKEGQFVFFTTTLYNPTSQLAEGDIFLEIRDEETGGSILSMKQEVTVYDHSTISFRNQVRINSKFKAGKTYRYKVTPEFRAMGKYPFTVMSKPENELVFTIYDPAGVEDVAADANITVYPNPATDKVFIDTDANLISASLFAADGRLVKKTMNNTLDLTDCNAGYYIVSIETQDGIVNKQIIKK